MTTWQELEAARQREHPEQVSLVKWVCTGHLPRTPINNAFRHVPTPAQKQHQTMVRWGSNAARWTKAGR